MSRRRGSWLFGVVSALLLWSCGAPSADPTAEPSIREAMAAQEAAWDRGDIRGFMRGYAEDICFIGKKGRTCGKEAVTLNYEKNYPDRAAMGDLRFVLHEVVPAGAGHAWVTGTWELFRTADTLGGGFSLLWRKDTDGWHIIRDHTY